MKKIMLFSTVILLFTNLSAQERKDGDVSEKVKAEFAKIYPSADKVKWERNSRISTASFIRDGKRVVIVFKGDILFSEMVEINKSDLPEAVVQHLAKYYKEFSVIRAGEIHFSATPDRNNVAYGADITDGKIMKRVVCFPNGNELMVTNLPDKEVK